MGRGAVSSVEDRLTRVAHIVAVGRVDVSGDAARPGGRPVRVGAVAVLHGRVGVRTQVTELQGRRRLQTRVRTVHLRDAVVDMPQTESVSDLMHQAVRLVRPAEAVRLHQYASCKITAIFLVPLNNIKAASIVQH